VNSSVRPTNVSEILTSDKEASERLALHDKPSSVSGWAEVSLMTRSRPAPVSATSMAWDGAPPKNITKTAWVLTGADKES
jgi:hypothetical protein